MKWQKQKGNKICTFYLKNILEKARMTGCKKRLSKQKRLCKAKEFVRFCH
jgi:hypothetical protein